MTTSGRKTVGSAFSTLTNESMAKTTVRDGDRHGTGPHMGCTSVRDTLPFLVVATAAFPLLYLPPASSRSVFVVLAAGVFVAIILSVLVVPWQRLPAWVQGGPAVAYVAVVALLRHAEGGTDSGYAPLLLLPLFWVALYATRRVLGIMIVVCAAALVIPVVTVAGDAYPVSEWRRVLVLIGAGAILGFTTQHLTARIRQHASDAERRRAEHEVTEASLAAVGLIARELSHDNVREQVAEAACGVSGADVAFVLEPGGRGSLVTTATVGLDKRSFDVALDDDTGAVTAFTEGHAVLVEVDEERERVEPAVAATGLRAVLYEPLLRHREPVGVLGVGWSGAKPELPEASSTVVHLLAGEAAVAMERADLLNELNSMARTDALTGLPNRRAWEDALHRESARAERGGEQFALALLDLDHFKVFNDTYGHPAGDKLLKRLAAIWQLHLRDADVLARWGGEEFAVLLPGCDEREALRTVERLRATIPEDETCSAGLAVWSEGETADSLVSRADRALYRAKEAGRDRTIAA